MMFFLISPSFSSYKVCLKAGRPSLQANHILEHSLWNLITEKSNFKIFTLLNMKAMKDHSKNASGEVKAVIRHEKPYSTEGKSVK